MSYFNPTEFDFVDTWGVEEKKYVSAFFFKLRKKYPSFSKNEYISYIKFRIFLEFRKNKSLKPSPSLFGTLRMELFRAHKKRTREMLEVSCSMEDCIDPDGDLDYYILHKDIEKICCKKTSIAVFKKLNDCKLTSYEYSILQKNREKLLAYLSL